MPYLHDSDFYFTDKTALRPPYLYNEILHTWTDGLYIAIAGPDLKLKSLAIFLVHNFISQLSNNVKILPKSFKISEVLYWIYYKLNRELYFL